MTALSPQDAARALREVHQSEARSQQRRAYQRAAPHFFLWGLFWFVGYGATALRPQSANAVWLALVGVWVAASLVRLPWTGAGKRERIVDWRETARMRRTVATMGAGALLLVGTACIVHPRGEQIAAFIPMLISVIYVAAAIWGAGPRYGVIGGVLFALTLGGYLLLPFYFLWLMALAGGATLALTGAWLRSE